MTWMPTEWSQRTDASGPSAPSQEPASQKHAGHKLMNLHVIGTVLRVAFLGLLVLITLRVSLPQNETLWTIYDTPGDVIRLLLGLGVCAWVGAQLFFSRVPRDDAGYATWVKFGLVAVPFALICLIAVW
jgi:hypothetical protein